MKVFQRFVVASICMAGVSALQVSRAGSQITKRFHQVKQLLRASRPAPQSQKFHELDLVTIDKPGHAYHGETCQLQSYNKLSKKWAVVPTKVAFQQETKKNVVSFKANEMQINEHQEMCSRGENDAVEEQKKSHKAIQHNAPTMLIPDSSISNARTEAMTQVAKTDQLKYPDMYKMHFAKWEMFQVLDTFATTLMLFYNTRAFQDRKNQIDFFEDLQNLYDRAQAVPAFFEGISKEHQATYAEFVASSLREFKTWFDAQSAETQVQYDALKTSLQNAQYFAMGKLVFDVLVESEIEENADLAQKLRTELIQKMSEAKQAQQEEANSNE